MPKIIFTIIFSTMKYFKLFILLISIISCTSSGEDSNLINQSKVESEIKSDSLIKHYDNGNVKIAGSLVNNLREGLWVSYFENGTKQSEHNYNDGLLNGSITVFINSGKLLYQGFYVEGKQHGKWIYYNKEQQPIKTIWFENGTKK